MPRYYFHTDDGRRYADEHGTECTNLADAQRVAVGLMTEMATALTDELWNGGCLRITATDEQGLTLMVLDLNATTSPGIAYVTARPSR